MIEQVGMSNEYANRKNLLDIHQLVEDATVERLAYVVSAKGKVSNGMPSGYFVYRIADVNGDCITATQINVSDYAEQGLAIQSLCNKAVKIKFTAQEYEGRLVLRILEISRYDSHDFPYESFIGKLKEAPKLLAFVNSTLKTLLNVTFEKSFENAAFDDIFDGKLGGICFLASSVLSTLQGYIGLQGYSFKQAATVFYYSLDSYYKYRVTSEDKVGKAVSYLTTLSYVNNTAACLPDGDPLQDYVADTLSLMLGIKDRASTFYGYIVYNTFNAGMNLATMATSFSNVTLGSVLLEDNARIMRLE